MAHSAGLELDQHLALHGRREVDLLDDEGLTELLEDGGAELHGGGARWEFERAQAVPA